MLAQAICQPTSPYNLNLKYGYFCMRIKGCYKFWNVDFDEFILVSLLIDVVLRFSPGVFKNWWIDIARGFVDRFKLDADCPIADVIATFKELVCRRPTS